MAGMVGAVMPADSPTVPWAVADSKIMSASVKSPFKCGGHDEDAGDDRVMVGGGDDRVGLVSAGLDQRLFDRGVGLDDQTVEVAGDVVGAVLVLFDHHDLVAGRRGGSRSTTVRCCRRRR